MQDDIQQRAVDLENTVVINKSQFPEPVHEEADPRTGCANHFRQHLLADLWNHSLGYAFFAKAGEQQKDPSQSLFARIEKLVNQIFFIADVPRQQVVIAVAESIRSAWPASDASPKKSRPSSIPIVASLPVFETTVSFTVPVWI